MNEAEDKNDKVSDNNGSDQIIASNDREKNGKSNSRELEEDIAEEKVIGNILEANLGEGVSSQIVDKGLANKKPQEGVQ